MGIRISIVRTMHRARDEILLFERRKIPKYEKDTDESRDIIYSAVMTAMSSRCVKDVFRIALNRPPGAFISRQDSPQVKEEQRTTWPDPDCLVCVASIFPTSNKHSNWTSPHASLRKERREQAKRGARRRRECREERGSGNWETRVESELLDVSSWREEEKEREREDRKRQTERTASHYAYVWLVKEAYWRRLEAGKLVFRKPIEDYLYRTVAN